MSLSVGPGYDDRRVRPWNAKNTKSRQDGRYYDSHWQQAIAMKPDFVSITSFNEWMEGRAVKTRIIFRKLLQGPRSKPLSQNRSSPLFIMTASIPMRIIYPYWRTIISGGLTHGQRSSALIRKVEQVQLNELELIQTMFIVSSRSIVAHYNDIIRDKKFLLFWGASRVYRLRL